VRAVQKINESNGGFGGVLHDEDEFGYSVAGLGDVDGNGVPDLAVGAYEDDDGGTDRGAVWILFLKADSTVLAWQKISQTQGGFGGTLEDLAGFGTRLAGVGDVDGDGVRDLAVSARRLPLQPPFRSSIWVLLLHANGTVKAWNEIRPADPAFVPALEFSDFLGVGLAAVGDLDGDGVPDLAAGAAGDDDGGRDKGAVWLLLLNPDGTLKGTQKISEAFGGLPGGYLFPAASLRPGSAFGHELSFLGDIDGDGDPELMAAAYGETRYVRQLVLSIDAGLQVSQVRTISNPDLGFPDLMGWGNAYGTAFLGDVDGDGGPEIALGYAGTPNSVNERVTVGYLKTDASVRKRYDAFTGRGALSAVVPGRDFGYALANLGDLNGDGAPELAAGQLADNQGGPLHGSVWILSLSPTAVRNGSGLNPLALSQNADPVLGQSWDLTCDCSGLAPGLALVTGRGGPLSGVFLPQGELLLDVTTPRYFQRLQAHAGGPVLFSLAVPSSLALISLPLSVQGLCTGAPAPAGRLTNALDVLVGR